MPSFTYKVKDKAGRTTQGQMDAPDQRSVAAKLREEGYFIVEVHEEHARRSGESVNPLKKLILWFWNPIFAGATPQDLAVFYRQLATMIRSGMALTQAMASLQTQGGNRRLKKIAGETLPHLQQGGRLSDVFAKYPWMFSDLQISLLRAGEGGGTLERVLDRIASYMEREVRVRQSLRLATLYPKILVLAVIFIPEFPVLILAGGKAYLNATLSILGPILIGLIAIWSVYKLFYQIPAVKDSVDMFKLTIPKIGKMVKMLAVSKYYRVLSSMFASGMPISQGLVHAANACGNRYLAKKLKSATPGVMRGEALSDCLARSNALPQMGLDMLKTGERTGNVDEMLDKAAEYTENEAEVQVIQSTVILGVVMMLAVAAYIGYYLVTSYLGMANNSMDVPD